MTEFFTPDFLFELVATAIGFVTFIKLISKNVYINNHKLLPSIVATIVIYDFYHLMVPFMKGQSALDMLYLMCDMCAIVILFLIFYYVLFLRDIKNILWIVVVTLPIMVGLCAYEADAYRAGRTNTAIVEMVAVVTVFLSSLASEGLSEKRNYFDMQDRTIARYMLAACTFAMLGFVMQIIFPQYEWLRTFGFALDCLIFYWMADTNQIEDTANILRGTLYDRLEYPIGLVNADFYVVDVNQAARRVFANTEDIVYAFKDGNPNKIFTYGKRMVESGENDEEVLFMDRWYQIHWQNVSNDKGTKGYIFTATDITEKQKENTEAKMEVAQKSKFLANMSYELRSPLHSIMGISDILIDRDDISIKNKGLIDHIKRSSENLLELVDTILDYSKIGSDSLEFADKEYDTAELFESMTVTTLANIENKPIEFSTECVTEFPKFLIGDVIRVREIFHNLFSNAIKYTDKGLIKCRLSFDIQDDDRVKVNFEVSDTGAGMTQDQLDQLFKEYISSDEESALEGTGLGLTITKLLIEKMGGHIYASSEEGVGSKFYGDFFQSWTRGEMRSPKIFNRVTISLVKSGFSNAYLKPEYIYPEAKVLIVDDMEVNIGIIKQLISPWKVQVVTATDGMQALEAVAKDHFDLIFMDQIMEPMNGLETCDEIKKISDVPIVLTTANIIDEVQRIMARHGFVNYLSKPIHASHVKLILEKYLPKSLAVNINNRQTNVEDDLTITRIYRETLSAFVQEMGPTLLALPKLKNNDLNGLVAKLHGIEDACKQIGRKLLAEQALILQMAIKTDNLRFLEEHFDTFLGDLADVVDDITKELTQFNSDSKFSSDI
ncbi:MAG: response regulator [Pseudobutyrivibrio sp.]|nr:response regulator [Pseudobutyrivibrio sp.]